MASLLSTPDLDTWLARLLHKRGRIDMQTLLGFLARVRADRSAGTLAEVLARRGLVSEEELLTCVGELRELVALTRPTATLSPIGWGPGQQIDGLTIERKLGAGGMGAVYVALDPETGARYAVKVLPRGATPEDVLRFAREAEAQAAVDRHPNVVRIHRSGRAAGHAYLVMDLATGGDLKGVLAKGPLGARDAAVLIRDLARGLAHVHAQGVLHRDLKPANVVFGEDGTPKLVDFGLARREGAETLTQTGEILGTPGYMAPEQIETATHTADVRTDVYGLGAMLFHCLTGRPPFTGSSIYALLSNVLREPPPPPRSLNPEVSVELEKICLRALEKAPGDRPPDAAALADQLDLFLVGAAARRAKPAWPAAAALVAIVVLGVSWTLASGDGSERAVVSIPPRAVRERPVESVRARPAKFVISEAEIKSRLKDLDVALAAHATDLTASPRPLLTQCEELLALAPDDGRVQEATAVALQELASKFCRTEEWKSALETASRSLEIWAEVPRGHAIRARALLGLEQLEQAIVAYSRAIDGSQIRAEERDLLVKRAQIYRDLDKDEFCLKDLERALQLPSSDWQRADLYREQGLTLARLGRPEEALKKHDQALRLSPEDSGALAARANARTKCGDSKGALEDLIQAHRFERNSVQREALAEQIRALGGSVEPPAAD